MNSDIMNVRILRALVCILSIALVTTLVINKPKFDPSANESASAATVNLIKKYQFSERQAKAIVDMKLGRLAHLEKIELNKEQEELTSTIANCEEVIKNVDKQKEIYLNRFNTFVKKYKDERKTELTHIDIKPEEKEIAEVVPVDVVVVTTESGLIKKIPVANFKTQRRGGKGIKSNDDVVMSAIKTNTVDYMMLFSDKGKMYRIVVDNIPDGTSATKGVPINSLIQLEPNEKIIAVTSLHRQKLPQFVLFFTKQGMIKKSFLSEYLGAKRNAGIAALKLKEGDSVASVIFQDLEDIVVVTRNGMNIRFATKDIGAVGRNTMGVKAINLNEGDEILTALPVHKDTDSVAIFSVDGMGKKVELKEFTTQARGGKGTILYKGALAGAAMVSDEDNILINGSKSSICISAKDISTQSKVGIGVIVIKNSKINSIAKF